MASAIELIAILTTGVLFAVHGTRMVLTHARKDWVVVIIVIKPVEMVTRASR